MVRVKIEKIVDLARQRAEDRKVAAEVEQRQAAERAAEALCRVVRAVLYKQRQEDKAKHEMLRRKMSEECVMTMEDIKRGLRCQGDIWADLRVLSKAFLAAQL